MAAIRGTLQQSRNGRTIPFRSGEAIIAGAVRPRGLLALLFGILATAILSIGLAGFGAKTAGAASTCTESLQALIDAAPAGGVVTAAPCIYRERIVIVKPLTLEGQEGTEIRGSDIFGVWKKRSSDGRFVSTRTVPRLPETMNRISCIPHVVRCHLPEQVFVDGRALKQVVGNKPTRHAFSLTKDRRVILGSRINPRGKIIEVSVRREWVVGTFSADDVTIDNVDMRHAANSGRTAALLNRPNQTAWDIAGSNWTVKNSTLAYAHGAIISLKGGAIGHHIENNKILFGGQIGIHGVARGSEIIGNEIAHNNTERYCPNARCGIGETGGIKITNASNVTVDGNHIHDNFGHGIHFDVDTHDNTITNNRIYRNSRMGIQYEVSSDALIAHNRIIGNGYDFYETVKNPSINVLSSSNVEVADNIISGGSSGINIAANIRDGFDSTVSGVYVHDNAIIRSGGPALTWSDGNRSIAADPTNRGYSNDYWYPHGENGSVLFKWAGKDYSQLSRFNLTPGEEDGRYMSDVEKNALLAE
jgi:parallel beta-helix repeat protein